MDFINSLINSELGLYDSNSPDRTTVLADKVIDVSHLCPRSKQVVIKYINVTRGRIAQICDLYEAGKDLGVTVHYHINEFTPDILAKDEVFKSRSVIMGVDPELLSDFIFANQ